MEAVSTSVEILEYDSQYKNDFKRLNMEWMAQFKLDVAHQLLIDDPEAEIINKGGAVFFAKVDNQIVGTGALIRESNKLYEIADMAVTPQYRGRHIGKSLLIKAVEKAKSLGAKQVYLITSTHLTTSIEMYKTYGFRETPFDPEMSRYEGSDVKMVLNLK